MEDYYECLHHKKEVSRLPHNKSLVVFRDKGTTTEALVGCENESFATCISKSRGCTPKGRCTKGRDNQESRPAGFGGRYEDRLRNEIEIAKSCAPSNGMLRIECSTRDVIRMLASGYNPCCVSSISF